MQRTFIFSFLAGIALSVVLAAVMPLPRHERIASSIEVLTNGGRSEEFIIRFPEDRIALPDVPSGLIVLDGGAAYGLAQANSAAGAELFRLRDVDDQIIGVASRISARTPSSRSPSVSNWMLMIPSRGSLVMTQQDSADVSPVRTTQGWTLPARRAPFWAAGSRYRITSGPEPGGQGRVLRGTAEFARLTGSYVETWERNSSSGSGEISGRIRLSTVLRGPQ